MISALANETAQLVLLETHWTGLVTWQLWTLLAAAQVTTMLVLYESKRTLLLAGHSLALFGSWATLANGTAMGICLEAKRALEGAAGDQTATQLLTGLAVAGAAAGHVETEAVEAVVLGERAVLQCAAGRGRHGDVGRLFADGAALAGHGDRVEAAVSTGSRHAAGISANTLAEGAVVLAPVVTVGQDLTVDVATGEVEHWVDWIFTHGAAFALRDVVALTVEDATLSGEADGHAPLAAAEAASVHAEHVPILVLHPVKGARRLGLVDTLQHITAPPWGTVATGDHLRGGSSWTLREATQPGQTLTPCG